MKLIKALVLCLLLTTCFRSYAHENSPCCNRVIDLDRKFYVDVDQINFNNNRIYISVGDLTYETPAIFSDKNGYYIEQVAKSGDCAWYEWQCTRRDCKSCNLRGIDYECRSCKKPISQ